MRSRIPRCFALTSQSILEAGKLRRIAAATGIACTISPSAPRRTIRNRFKVQGSRFKVLGSDPSEQIAGRVILGVADDRRAAAVGDDGRALGDRFDLIVGPLAMDVRLQPQEQALD